MPDDNRSQRPSNNRRHNPLDDLLTDAEIRSESQKLATRFYTGSARPKRHVLKTPPVSVVVMAALLLVIVGIVLGQQLAQKADTLPTEVPHPVAELRESRPPTVPAPTETKIEAGQSQANASADVQESLAPKTEILVAKEYPVAKESVPQEAAKKEGEIIDRARQSVVHLEVTHNARGNIRATGSGFFVRDPSTVTTNFHVIDGARSAKIVLQDGTRLDVLGVERLDQRADLAVLKIANPVNRVVVPLPLGPEMPPNVLSDVFVIGSPVALKDTVTQGKVSNNDRDKEGMSRLQIDAFIHFGSSGCPVLNSEGRVVGIAYSGVPGTRINFAVQVSDLVSLLNRDSEFQSLSELFAERKRLLNAERAKLRSEVAIVTDEVIEFVKGLRPSFQKMSDYHLLKGATYSQLAKREAMIARREAKAEDSEKSQKHRRDAERFWRNARYEFREALEIDPSESQGWYEIGSTYLDENRHVREQKEALDAIAAFRSGTQANQNDADCWRGLGIAILSLRFSKKPVEAVEALRRAITINPKDAQSYAALGDALLDLEKVDDARGAYKTAMELAPQDYDCQFCYGSFLRRIGDYQATITAFETALILAKDSEVRRVTCEEELEKTRRLTSDSRRKD